MYDSRPVVAEPKARIVRLLAARTAAVPSGPAVREVGPPSDDDLIWG
ncbi:hypothetical protein [Streptomyces sp. NPDC046862]